ncbi:MAG TPA: HD-GYP domain-containing protein [Ideonella sp.]|nr:HD-GYP domain-containing protein [Ideonella sp.]
MLKRIPASQVRLGMHLHALDGAWMDHPFWRTRFTLSDADDLAKLRQSAIAAVWIDVSKGCDVAEPLPAKPRLRRDAAVAELVLQAAAVPEPARPAPPSTSFTEELQRATAVCKQGRDQVVALFGEARLGQAVNAEGCLPLVNDIAESVFRNPAALVSLARLKTQDDYSFMHSVAVCALMVSLGRELGLGMAECRDAGLAGLLHDLGKALLPLELLNKPGRLTPEEFEIVKTHPRRGHAMLLEGGSAGAAVLDVCLHHHERMDGTGYPERLPGERISRVARMGAVCDVYDAITSNRPYKLGWDPAESIARMASWKGHFDPVVLQAFVKGLGIYPIGSLVRLQSGKLAVVVEQSPISLGKPVVKLVFSTHSQMPMSPQRLELARSADRIVGRENPQTWGFKQLDALWAGDEVLRKLAA